ncbi:hypothetical protein [Burkholderia anthina]|uniref:hypothetical protein n=1 Tax=Burkholderia anthina TaxID=179879 RepID=UPI0015891372|nr:hypothetical protein [Burkholderia anthina]
MTAGFGAFLQLAFMSEKRAAARVNDRMPTAGARPPRPGFEAKGEPSHVPGRHRRDALRRISPRVLVRDSGTEIDPRLSAMNAAGFGNISELSQANSPCSTRL